MAGLRANFKCRYRWGVSPIIATVILLAVSITVAVAIASYMSGITQSNANFEKVEIMSAYSEYDSGFWTVNVHIKNAGPTDATLSYIMINGNTIDAYDTGPTSGNWTTNMIEDEIIESGQTIKIQIYLARDKAGKYVSSGTTIDIRLHSIRGFDYIKLVKLA
jgi:flagellin-like protein